MAFVESYLDKGEKSGLFIPLGSKSCDCEWLFIVTEEWYPQSLKMPQWFKYLMDPVAVAKHYTDCSKNTNKTSLEGYGLESLMCYVQQKTTIENVHSSIGKIPSSEANQAVSYPGREGQGGFPQLDNTRSWQGNRHPLVHCRFHDERLLAPST